MGIKKKLLVSFFVIIFTLVISGGFFVAVDYIILSKYMTLTDNMISEYKLIDETSSLISSFNKRIKSPYDTGEVANFNNKYYATKELIAKLKKVIVDRDSQIIFSGIENNLNDVFFNLESGMRSLSTDDYLAAVGSYEEVSRKMDFVEENVNKLLLNELEYAKKLQIEIEKIRIASKIIATSFLMLVLLICVVYAIKFSKKLVSPLVKLAKLAKIIETGDYKASVDTDLLLGDDEVASLANSFNNMVLSIQNSISQLQKYNFEIKKSHNLLQIEKNKLQQYLDIAGVIVLIFDNNNNVLLINKKGREIINVKNKEIIGKNWIGEFVDKEYRKQTESLLSFLRGGTALTDMIENVIVSKDKVLKNIVWHFSVISNNLNSESILATGVDVTELTNAKVTINQLKEVDRLKNEVLNVATHELKTPLISIVGLTEVMEKQPKTIPDDYQKYISIIHVEGLKLTNLIKTMLTTSRNDIGKMVINKEKFDLGILLKSFETSLNILAKKSASVIKLNLPDAKVLIESDKSKIAEVVYNFVDNAVKYGTKKQEIKINLSLVDKNNIKVEVISLGQGISKERQKKLFLKFSQLEPSLSRSQDGMGLGLYICKQNIESLGGKIGVLSEEGQETNFFFTLPLTF